VTDAFLIIDASQDGLQHAPQYYAAFPREPSLLGVLTLDPSRTTAMTQASSLFTALPEMVKAGAGGVVMLVCHASVRGLRLALSPTGKHYFAELDVNERVDKAIGAEAAVKRIRGMDDSTDADKNKVLAQWTILLNSLQANMVVGTFTQQEAETKYAGWIDMLSKQLEFANAAQFRQLLDRLLQVRALKLSRLELRACDIGADANTLNGIREFFGAQRITAPKLPTFYGPVNASPFIKVRRRPGVRGSSKTPRPLDNLLDWEEAQVVSRELAGKPATRGFIPIVNEPREIAPPLPTRRSGVRPFFDINHFAVTYKFVMRVARINDHTYTFAAGVTADRARLLQDWSVVRTFVNQSIMPNAKYQSGIFPVAGLWNAGVKDQMYILPNEPQYLENFAQSPVAAPPASTKAK
jgi:hypothetical protein